MRQADISLKLIEPYKEKSKAKNVTVRIWPLFCRCIWAEALRTDRQTDKQGVWLQACADWSVGLQSWLTAQDYEDRPDVAMDLDKERNVSLAMIEQYFFGVIPFFVFKCFVCSLKKRLTPKMYVLCFVIINSVHLNLSCVWILVIIEEYLRHLLSSSSFSSLST